jgi:hypothetical protein
MSGIEVRYNKRVWLNDSDSEYTGSVVSFDGIVERVKNRLVDTTFLELSDCVGKVNLHKAPSEDMKRFINKLRLLSNEVNEFANHLEKRDAEITI